MNDARTPRAPAPWPPEPTRAAALRALADVVPRTGADYAMRRNLDAGPGAPSTTSRLSVYLRHRLLTEAEVIAAARAAHGPGADRFVTEVLWRTYFKGWLERRPGVWRDYLAGVRHGQDRTATEAGLRADWAAACRGETGIDGFDDWARTLAKDGWLHNHARMWFASIWIFTLRLPWELGADFFLRHLIDGDPASNTLSWRWVAGLHTAGKHYVADAEVIARCTDGRFRPRGLATDPQPLTEGAPAEPGPVPSGDRAEPGLRSALLIHSDDLGPTGWLTADGALAAEPEAPLPVLWAAAGLSPLDVAPQVRRITRDAAASAGEAYEAEGALDALAERLCDGGTGQVIVPHAPVGPVADALAALNDRLSARGVRMVRRVRDWDVAHWPQATRGFYRFRKATFGVTRG